MSALCIASGALATQLTLSGFTLMWTHSIEKVLWEEDWRIEAAQLVLVEGRVRGSGAGMEPPEGSRLVDGVWHYPGALRVDHLTLAHSPYTQGYTLCVEGRCRPLAELLPGLPEIPTLALAPCTTDSARRQ
jgi:hypothetical protein